ncbi:MAG: AraC family transcriptional regulator [Bacteroidaceae bacterium]|nr:AraC family transcriptional regulator [Bacteroidaceae bacterium]
MYKYSNIINDAFSPEKITPSCAIPNEILLFDNYGQSNPLQPMSTNEGWKLRHMTIFFLMQGKVEFRINGEEVKVTGGQVLTTMPDTEVRYRFASYNNKYLLFVIYPELLSKVYGDINLNYDKTTFDKGYLVASCNEEEMSLYQILYAELKKECHRDNYEFQMIAVRSYLNALIINGLTLYKISKINDRGLHSRQYDVYQNFMDQLNLHAKNERTVQFYAGQLHISPKYLSYVTMQYSNKNASQWISEYVAHHAKTMLCTQHLSTEETARQLNFPTKNSFCRFFKRVTGLSPKEFIRSMR